MDGMTRRSLLRAGAWSAPVVALAIGAPGAASSPVPVLGLSWELGTANFVPLDFGAQVWSYLRVTNLSNETTPAAILIQVLPPGPAYELNYNEGELSTLSSAPVTLTTGTPPPRTVPGDRDRLLRLREGRARCCRHCQRRRYSPCHGLAPGRLAVLTSSWSWTATGLPPSGQTHDECPRRLLNRK